MSNDEFLPDMKTNMTPPSHETTNCLRCGEICRRGTPDLSKQAIRQATEGFCPACMVEKFLRSIEPIRALFEGTGKRPAQLQPEIFLDHAWREQTLRPVMKLVLAHTQLPEDSIDWVNVVSNWGTPFPKGREPGLLL